MNNKKSRLPKDKRSPELKDAQFRLERACVRGESPETIDRLTKERDALVLK